MELTSEGDLFLISAALSADAFGRALLTLLGGIAVVGGPAPAPWSRRQLYAQSILCVGCIVVLVPDALFFSSTALGRDYNLATLQHAVNDRDMAKADRAVARVSSGSDSETRQPMWSALFFSFAVVAGIGAIVGEEG